jgi:hypothetical protein
MPAKLFHRRVRHQAMVEREVVSMIADKGSVEQDCGIGVFVRYIVD